MINKKVYSLENTTDLLPYISSYISIIHLSCVVIDFGKPIPTIGVSLSFKWCINNIRWIDSKLSCWCHLWIKVNQ